MNKIRVMCNPYEKTISFRRYDEEKNQWVALGDGAELLNYTKNVSVQNCGADILNMAYKSYHRGSGSLSIEYWGTKDDYEDICEIYKTVKDTCPEISIELKKELKSSAISFPKIKDIYCKTKAKFRAYMPEYTEQNSVGAQQRELAEYIEKFDDISCPPINICIVGHYSAGKSTLINALIGAELLPTATDPTTARITVIQAKEEISMSFTYKGQAMTIRWNDSGYSYCDNSEFFSDITHKLDEAAREKIGVVSQINVMLTVLNKRVRDEKTGAVLDSVLANVDAKIDISYPISSQFLSREFEYRIIDTPGSNAGTFSETHKAILQQVLKDQTNALPLMVYDCQQWDSVDTENLRKMLGDAGRQIDIANLIAVMNQSDKLTVGTLEKRKDSEVQQTKFKNLKVAYTSAAIALGAKKKEISWIDSETEQVYQKNKKDFFRTAEQNGAEVKALYRYDVLPEPDKTVVMAHCENGNNEQMEILNNSGISALEILLNQFAEKYALYLKCEEGYTFLLKILEKVKNAVEAQKAEVEETRDKDQKEREKKRSDLLKEIESITLPNTETLRTNMSQIYNPKVDEFIKSLVEKTKSEVKKAKTKKLNGEMTNAVCHQQMVCYCDGECYAKLAPEIREHMVTALNEMAQGHKGKILDCIECKDEITNETKEHLRELSIQNPRFSASDNHFDSKKAFSKFFWVTWINPKKYAKELGAALRTDFGTDCITKPLVEMESRLNDWAEDTKKEYTSKIDEKSFYLQDFDKKLKELEIAIDSNEKSLSTLENSRNELTTFLRFEEETEL